MNGRMMMVVGLVMGGLLGFGCDGQAPPDEPESLAYRADCWSTYNNAYQREFNECCGATGCTGLNDDLWDPDPNPGAQACDNQASGAASLKFAICNALYNTYQLDSVQIFEHAPDTSQLVFAAPNPGGTERDARLHFDAEHSGAIETIEVAVDGETSLADLGVGEDQVDIELPPGSNSVTLTVEGGGESKVFVGVELLE